MGAGPGAADLLTLRAARLLQVADVVVMDALVGQEVLQHCAPHCQVVLMGKRGGDDGAANQHDINQALVDLCRAGKQVVRLKGGDPLLFGRAADEIRALRAAGCVHLLFGKDNLCDSTTSQTSCPTNWPSLFPCKRCDYELVPGITSPFAAAAEVELMLTHKIHSSTLALATGHDPSLLNFSALAATDTVVLLMATRTLDTIVAELQAAGRSADTPVAILKNATLPSRQAWHGTLGTIVGATRGQALSPSIVIIGEAARLAPDQRPVL